MFLVLTSVLLSSFLQGKNDLKSKWLQLPKHPNPKRKVLHKNRGNKQLLASTVYRQENLCCPFSDMWGFYDFACYNYHNLNK